MESSFGGHDFLGNSSLIKEMGCILIGPTMPEIMQQERNQKTAIQITNVANLVLFILKVYACIESKSLVVIASTMNSFLVLLSGFILWITANATRNANQSRYLFRKKHMHPVGIIVFASVMATMGLQVLYLAAQRITTKTQIVFDPEKEKWMIGIMALVTLVKFTLWKYCQRYLHDVKLNDHSQDHFVDVVTNTTGIIAVILGTLHCWRIDPIGATIVTTYTMRAWGKTLVENVGSLIGKTASLSYISFLTSLVSYHDSKIKRIDTIKAYTFGYQYFVEVEIVFSEDTPFSQAYHISKTLQEKLEQLSQVERAFVHVNFDLTH